MSESGSLVALLKRFERFDCEPEGLVRLEEELVAALEDDGLGGSGPPPPCGMPCSSALALTSSLSFCSSSSFAFNAFLKALVRLALMAHS